MSDVESELAKQNCEACRIDAPKVSEQEQQDLLKQIPEWQVLNEQGVPKLKREFSFKDFQQAVDFANRVAELAEQENHHPEIHISWGKTSVSWWTHKIEGLHRNDFIMAARCDHLY